MVTILGGGSLRRKSLRALLHLQRIFQKVLATQTNITSDVRDFLPFEAVEVIHYTRRVVFKLQRTEESLWDAFFKCKFPIPNLLKFLSGKSGNTHFEQALWNSDAATLWSTF